MRHSILRLACCSVFMTACAPKKAPPPTDTPSLSAAPGATTVPAGESYLAVDGGRIWYKVSGAGHGTPIVILHGGPGYSSFYTKPLEALGDEWPVVRYDQLGGGKSDPLTDTTKMTIAHFVRELDSLRSHLGYSRMHLIGHSWGTILAVEYYRVHPEHVASLSLGSAALDIPAWVKNTRRLVATLSPAAQLAIHAADSSRRFDSPGYNAAIDEFYGRYVWRHPVKADLDSTMSTVGTAIYNYMQGPSEFTITGTLKNYDVTQFLGTIKVPVIYTVGEFDEADPATIKRFASMTPGAQVAVLAGSAHITPWDAPVENVRVLRAFLRHADSMRTAP